MPHATPAGAASERKKPTNTAGSAEVIDHVGPPLDPYRVTVMRLARKRETYELRWRENVRQDDGTVTRERRNEPGE